MELEMKLQSAPKSAHPQGWSLKFIGWAKYKEKVPNVSDLNQNVETTY